MSARSDSQTEAFGAGSPTPNVSDDVRVELGDELRNAAENFDRGDYIDLSNEQLADCVATGESPWPEDSDPSC
jgi:hypothetical protein